MQHLDHQRDSKLSACVDDLVFEAIVEPEAPPGNEPSPMRTHANGSPASLACPGGKLSRIGTDSPDLQGKESPRHVS